MIRDPSSSRGLTLERYRQTIDFVLGRQNNVVPSELDFSPGALRVLKSAAEKFGSIHPSDILEAIRKSKDNIGYGLLENYPSVSNARTMNEIIQEMRSLESTSWNRS